MIQPTDLRIGNKVEPKPDYANQFPAICEVTQVYKTGFTVDYHYPGAWFEPIPPSPEILEACGFEFHPSKGRLCYPIDIGIVLAYYDGTLYNYESGSIIKCIYLHQIQNLIFAMTGRELEIKMKQTI